MIYQEFLDKAKTDAVSVLENFISTNKLKEKIILDHICYKCASNDEFVAMRKMLEPEALYLYESWISERLIAVIKLKTPIETMFGPLHFVELQDAKNAPNQKSGFTHIEAYPVSGYQETIEYMRSRGVAVVEDPTPHHPIHEVSLNQNFTFRLEREPVIEKIKREEL